MFLTIFIINYEFFFANVYYIIVSATNILASEEMIMKEIKLEKKIGSDVYVIKNVHENKYLSDETPCFSCALYKNGIKLADVSNGGQGALDDFRFVAGVELPPYGEERFRYEGTLSGIVYELLDLREIIYKFKRSEKYCLLLVKDDRYLISGGWKRGSKKVTIEEMKSDATSAKILHDTVAKYEREGYEIMNTNI